AYPRREQLDFERARVILDEEFSRGPPERYDAAHFDAFTRLEPLKPAQAAHRAIRHRKRIGWPRALDGDKFHGWHVKEKPRHLPFSGPLHPTDAVRLDSGPDEVGRQGFVLEPRQIKRHVIAANRKIDF